MHERLEERSVLMDHPFNQTVIALIWDFDKTLIQGYMQEPIFNKYNVDGAIFWQEVNALKETYSSKGIKINQDTIYLNHILTCVNQGIFEGLDNRTLLDLGRELIFYPGIPEVFSKTKEQIQKDPKYQIYGIEVEHYIVSTGLAQMIRGSIVSDYVDGIWGCEFIEAPVKSSLDIKEYRKTETETKNQISQIGYVIDNTSKTRAIFEINKGSNKHIDIDVNSSIVHEMRRIPFENMIYIADGPSDVPVFSLLKQYKGRTFAVYPKGNEKAFGQVDQLIKDNRIDAFGEADYTDGTTTFLWIQRQVNQIADRICQEKDEAIRRNVSMPPKHINS